MTPDDDTDDDTEELLREYRAAVARIDEAVALVAGRAEDALACARGCSACCADGLSVLPVEAVAIELSGARPPVTHKPGMCAFLDEDDACTIYDARPVLCRTHGLALRQSADPQRGALTVLNDVGFCALNYTERAPAPDEVLDAERMLMLLVTVDRRFRARVGIDDDGARVPLAHVADELRAALTASGRT